jgi:hypothetical protein
LARETEFLQLF